VEARRVALAPSKKALCKPQASLSAQLMLRGTSKDNRSRLVHRSTLVCPATQSSSLLTRFDKEFQILVFVKIRTVATIMNEEHLINCLQMVPSNTTISKAINKDSHLKLNHFASKLHKCKERPKHLKHPRKVLKALNLRSESRDGKISMARRSAAGRKQSQTPKC